MNPFCRLRRRKPDPLPDVPTISTGAMVDMVREAEARKTQTAPAASPSGRGRAGACSTQWGLRD